jgi:hypothetical protein
MGKAFVGEFRKKAATWGRCYDHNFPRFSAKKLAFYSKTNVIVNFRNNLALFLSQKRHFFFFSSFYLKKSVNSGKRRDSGATCSNGGLERYWSNEWDEFESREENRGRYEYCCQP